MDILTFALLLTIVGFVIGGLWSLTVAWTWSHSSSEPPLAPQEIPLIGHFLSLIRQGVNYYAIIGPKQQTPIYTINLGFFKLYVSNTYQLVAPIQRCAKTLSFTPFQKMLVKRISRVSPQTLALYDIGGKYPGSGAFVKSMNKVIHEALSPGPSLDWINLHAANELLKVLDDDQLMASPQALFQWMRHTITVASSVGVWGPLCPLATPEGEDAFWALDRKAAILVSGLPPRLFAPAAFKAMNSLDKQWSEYHRKLDAGKAEVSALVRGRNQIMKDHGISAAEMARMDWPIAIAVLSNSVPTAFWVLYEIISRPSLLAEVRAELASAISSEETGTHGASFVLDVAKIRADCRLLLSIFQETQRTRSIHCSIRNVMDDTQLDDRYLLKKGAYLQIPTALVHRNSAVWGADVATFDPYRFCQADRPKPPSNSFLPWGFAPHMCPARQFATTEILSLVAMMVVRFDVEPVDGEWPSMEVDESRLSTMYPPRKDVQVSFNSRFDWKGHWSVQMGSSTTKFPLASG